MNNTILLRKYAINYLSKYDSSKKNLRRILKNKILKFQNIDNNEKEILKIKINEIIKELDYKKIIDDERFAKNKLISLLEQGKSEKFIRSILYIKGIENNIINKIFLDIEKNNPDWKTNAAKNYIMKKKLGKYSNEKNYKKDLAKMARAGFSYDIIKKVLDLE